MDHDYYAILGVDETADRATIWTAYRRLAYERHPDRGGTHAQMVLLNLAWEMLGNAERRRHYDEARRATADAPAQHRRRQDEAAAKQSAEQYPTEWAALEKWWRSVADDIARTNYGDWLLDWHATGWTVELMMFLGGAVGFGVGVVVAMNIQYPQGGRAALNMLGVAIGVPTVVGAVAAKVLHYLLASFVRLGGFGPSSLGIRLSETELKRCAACGVIGAVLLLLIADAAEPKLTAGMTTAEYRTVWQETLVGKLKTGLLRGGLLGAVACFVLAKYELIKSSGSSLEERLPTYFPYRTALYGGLTLAVTGAVFGFASFPKSSGTVEFWRCVVGLVLGASACALTLLVIKQTKLAPASNGEPRNDASGTDVLPCVGCGQKLRIPHNELELWVTCPACGSRFSVTNGKRSASSAR